MKVDYITFATLSIQGHAHNLVIKVAPDQPALFGLDVMILFDMTLNLSNQTYQAKFPTPSMKLHKFDGLLQRFGITEDDLVPLSALPSPGDAYKMTVTAGQSHRLVDLGSSGLSFLMYKKLAL